MGELPRSPGVGGYDEELTQAERVVVLCVAEVEVGGVDDILDPLLGAQDEVVVDGLHGRKRGGKGRVHIGDEQVELCLGQGNLGISKRGQAARVDLGQLKRLSESTVCWPMWRVSDLHGGVAGAIEGVVCGHQRGVRREPVLPLDIVLQRA